MPRLSIRRPDDMHLHLRQGSMLATVLPHTLSQFARAVIMPNLTPPVLNVGDLQRYRQEIEVLLPDKAFTPLFTFKIVASTTPELVQDLKRAGAVAGKLYPEGVTTNSEDGVKDIPALYPVFQEMQKCGLVLCLHGEMPGVFSLDRETAFLSVLENIAKEFPDLKIVLEHITTAAAVRLVEALPANVAASITVHHLELTLDDVIGDKISPHSFCKPVAKRPEDRAALLGVVLSGNKKFFLGTDSAPHPQDKKECAFGCAGVYSAPVALPVLAQIFEAHQALEKLEAFCSENGALFYGLPLNTGTVTLVKETWTVLEKYGEVVPFYAGRQLAWQVAPDAK